ncbi:glutamine--fructose-6-phosphate transaminase (isomerizing) [Candidatus Uhrbacteria bacterium]|jgi:glutamine---fructose-6-phosphate transaminase (isomerizing)|nr:glutamine--fructose-6-phosphate transaminase (isomerizing) [Candidatus Uhrbacteria bacterium]
MCGIIGYTGTQEASPFLLAGLKRLEYRGYDSAGIGVLNKEINIVRAQGPICELEKTLVKNTPDGSCGIAHTRWATHGVPSEANAHPHRDCSGDIAIIHNGIIENHLVLRRALTLRGHVFKSQTDSEVISHLLEETIADTDSLQDAFEQLLGQLTGAYGIVAMIKSSPGTLFVARMGSPIVLGRRDGDRFVCSDATAMADWVDDVIYLDDGERALLQPNNEPIIWTKESENISKQHHTISWDTSVASKKRYAHFMLKEMMEQPKVVEDTMRGRLIAQKGIAHFGGLEDVRERLREIDRLIIVACGTAYYAGCVGEYMLEHYAGIPVEVELASEFRYRHPVINRHTAVLAITQSGETADTLAAIREAKTQGALTLGIVNVPGSTIARETDAGIYTRAGSEIGVASTKAFITQVTALAMLTLFFGRDRNLEETEAIKIAKELELIPDKIESILKLRPQIKALADKYQWMQNAFFLGRTYQAPIAYEGALKLKEISLIHAEGYSAGELKHGPLALIDERFPSIVICPRDEVYEKTLSNIAEIKARKGPVIAITDIGNTDIVELVDDVIHIPSTHEMLSPLLTAIPTQLFAYEMSLLQGYDPDKPRNLAKSVTVE